MRNIFNTGRKMDPGVLRFILCGLIEGDINEIMNVMSRHNGWQVDSPEGQTIQSVIAMDPEWAFYYSKRVLQRRWPEGEAAIAADAVYSYMYSRDVLRSRFELGEPAIAADAMCSYWYSRDVVKDRFPLGEPAISADPTYSYWYFGCPLLIRTDPTKSMT